MTTHIQLFTITNNLLTFSTELYYISTIYVITPCKFMLPLLSEKIGIIWTVHLKIRSKQTESITKIWVGSQIV